ncbi:Dipeptidyl-peptidase 5 [Smittium mucronatum]|uniref:Dipeptidyl-peptidase V n=1 Tax=Smittium mucronatum TaxID=133383 RepID=A0A1R0H614_9FUNG|nr:Dipeptidyl-peptidase 5 [Smittium mucronatum]
MRFCCLLTIPFLATHVLSDAFNPDPNSFPDWGKTGKFDPETFVELKRLSTPVLSPNRTKVVYSQYQYNIKDNANGRNLRLFDIQKGFQSAIDLTDYKYKQGDSSPIWVSDDLIAFTATRGTAASNIFTISTTSLKITQVTNFTNGISGISYGKEAGRIAFISKVYKGMGLEESAKERKRIASLPSSGIVFDHQNVRFFDTWILKDRSQLFTIPVKLVNNSITTTGDPVNIVEKYEGEWGLEPSGYDFSADGKSIVFSAKIEGKNEAWSADTGIFVSPVDGSTAPTRLNSNYQGSSASPVYSNDGKSIAWLQQTSKQNVYGQNQVLIYDTSTKTQTRLVEYWDRSPNSISFSDDDSKLILTVPYEKDVALFELLISNNTLTRISQDGTTSLVSQLSNDSYLVLTNTFQYPDTLFKLSKDSNGKYESIQISFENNPVLDKLWFSPTETFWFNGALNETVQALVLYPYGFNPSRKYPVFYLIHGGPHSSWYDGWSWRWNPNIYANQGYLLVIVNFHGGDAYGQKFTDSILKNWGSYPYEDLMTGLDVLLDNAPFADKENVLGVGASYGGYMVNWMNGQTDRFKAFVNHDGIFNTVGMYYSTDIIGYMEVEFGIPWIPEDRKVYEKYSPETYANNWKTPMFVVHSGMDFRVPISEGLSTFTTLQRKGIESKFLYFPDENHWVLKPQNVLFWVSEILEWCGKYTNTTVWSLGS